ncbi:MAG: serine/threonine-protein kinase [Nannocystaceae bacterium]
MSQPRRPLGPDLRGELLDDRYALEDIVGVGGSGNVYAARDRRLGRRVAVKVIHPEYARDEEQRRRIEQEARIGAQIAHEHVAAILDFGTWIDARGEALPYIVMQLLRGRTLREAVLDGPVPWWVAAGWVRQLLAGLSALHARGVLHRDVKLDNCLLVCEADRETLKLLDLGLAKVTRDDLLSRRPWSSAGKVVGSLPYISPEQALGEVLDERTDIYAAGVVLFELLTRRQPFVGSDYQVLSGHVEQAPPRPSEVASLAGIPAAIDAITLRALAKRPEARFDSALEFEAAVVEALGDAGIDVDLRPAIAGSGEAQAALAAWTCFDYEVARERAEIAARLNRAWSPLKLLMELAPEE